jgi:cell division protein FtsI (penicillin-binding protein 3)
LRAPDLARTNQRIAVVRAVLIAALALIAGRTGWLATDDRAASRGRVQADGQLHVRATRGEIQDRTGRQLAVSVDAPSVFVEPRKIASPRLTARRLARALGMSAERVEKRITETRGNFAFVARWISEEAKERVLALDLEGVGIVPEPKRLYPQGQLAGTIVGFMNVDEVGVQGVEKGEQDWLQGTLKTYPVERDAHGRKLPLQGVDPRATRGGDVRLTLDGSIQAVAEEALARTVRRHEALGGVLVALDPRNGDLLAVAERPGFDPNRFRKTRFRDSRARSFTDAEEPGSVMKAFVVAAALEHGVVRPDEEIDCEDGRFRVPGKTIHDHDPYDRLDLAGILAHSSNIGATKLAYRLGAQRHYEMLRAFGFGRRSGVGFSGESAGLLRSWERWQPVDQANVAFGQGMNVTAVQLAAATAVLANGGHWRQPRLIAARRPPGGPWSPARPSDPRRVVSEDTAARVLGLLETVVSPVGTGRLAGLHGVRVAGKTGTAQKLDRENGRYHSDRFVAWFVGVVPADDPRLVIVAAVDDPVGPLHSGGTVAAPLFAEVAASSLLHMGIYTRPEPIAKAVTTTASGDAPARDAARDEG